MQAVGCESITSACSSVDLGPAGGTSVCSESAVMSQGACTTGVAFASRFLLTFVYIFKCVV